MNKYLKSYDILFFTFIIFFGLFGTSKFLQFSDFFELFETSKFLFGFK
jgi:hypothetical protein